MKSDQLIIVIGRRFGSGGRRIGKLLAQRLGLRYFDRAPLSECASSLGFDPSIFVMADEKKPSPLRSLISTAFGVAEQCTSGGISREELYRAQGEVIRRLASEGGCVFVGRSADYILRHHPKLVSIFLTAPLNYRAKATVAAGEAPDEAKARDMARSKDRDREGFYNFFTGRQWGSADNYHLTADTSLLSDEAVCEMIECYVRGRGFKA